MKTFINVADLIDLNDPKGRTWRQINAEKKHSIPLGTLVEIDSESNDSHGLRLFVVHQGRDCDQTPLYWLSFTMEKYELEDLNKFRWFGGWSEESLKIIKLPE